MALTVDEKKVKIKKALKKINNNIKSFLYGSVYNFSRYISALRGEWKKQGTLPKDDFNSIVRNTQTNTNIGNLRTVITQKLKALANAQEDKATGTTIGSEGDIAALYTSAVHEEYMRWVFADYMVKVGVSGGDFTKEVNDSRFASNDAMTKLQSIKMNWQKFMPSGQKLTAAGPAGFEKSWDHLLDLLAQSDVSPNTSYAIDGIKARLKENREGAGGQNQTAGGLIAGLSAEEREIFFKNLPQELLIALEGRKQVPSSFRKYLRQVTWNESNSEKRHVPYGGRVIPVAVEQNGFLQNPFSWKFFRDVTSTNQIATKFQICKLIRRDGKLQEVALPLVMAQKISEGSSEDLTNECGAGYPDDSTNYLVENLNISFKGTTPATAQNDVEVSLTIHLPTVGSLATIHTKTGSPTFKWSILDLITYVGNTDESIYKNQYSGLSRSRVIMKIGYQTEKVTGDDILKNVLEQSPMILDLAVIDHTIEKDEQKPYAKLNIKYAGFAFKMLNSTTSDILAGDNLATRLERDKIINQAIDMGCDNKTVEDLINNVRDLNRDEVPDLRTTFLERLLARNRVFTLPYFPKQLGNEARGINGKLKLTNQFLDAWARDISNKPYKPGILKNGGSTTVDDVLKEAKDPGWKERYFNTAGTAVAEANKKDIHWTTIGDLVDVAMDTLYELKIRKGMYRESEGRKELFSEHPTKVIMDKMADYPVSIAFFLEWLKTEIADQDFDYYPLMGFIRQMIQVLVTNFINKQNEDDIPHFPVLSSVESGLGIPVPPTDTISAQMITNVETGVDPQESHAAANTDRFDGHVQASLKNNNDGTIRPPEIQRAFIAKNKWNPACTRDELLEQELNNASAMKKNFYPMIVKNYDSRVNHFINYIYCFMYTSKSSYVEGVKTPSDCIKRNIPVIRLSDFRYKDKKHVDALKETASSDGELEDVDENAVAQQQNIINSGLKPDGEYYHVPFQSAVVKSIKFSKKDDDYLREARYSSRNLGLFAQLTSVYSAKVQIDGFCSFLFPGQTVYIDSGIGSEALKQGSLANTLGLGGLHVITGVTHKIELEKNILKGIKTSFDAIFSFNNGARSFGRTLTPASEKVCEQLYETLPDPFSTQGVSSGGLTAADLRFIAPKKNVVETEKDRKTHFGKKEIKKTYRELAQRRNPDLKIPDNAKLQYIGDSYDFSLAHAPAINFTEKPEIPIYKITWDIVEDFIKPGDLAPSPDASTSRSIKINFTGAETKK